MFAISISAVVNKIKVSIVDVHIDTLGNRFRIVLVMKKKIENHFAENHDHGQMKTNLKASIACPSSKKA